MKNTKDDAVSAVIAMMLILAIISTCLAVYTTTYVPGLKQQSEITHSEEVRLALERFSADVDNIYSMGKKASFTEPLSLGGGDVILSPIKSGGTIEINDEVIGTIRLSDDSWRADITTSKMTFKPVYTSWEKQGYEYSKGLVWIVKENKRTPSGMSLLSINDGNVYSDKFTESIYDNIKNSFTSEVGKSSIYLPLMYADSDKNKATGSGIVKIRVESGCDEEKITVSSGISLLFTDDKGIEYNIHTFDSDTEFTVNKLNIEVSVK